jgi:hypothetical protein
MLLCSSGLQFFIRPSQVKTGDRPVVGKLKVNMSMLLLLFPVNMLVMEDGNERTGFGKMIR